MNETSIKLILEFIILRLIWTMNKQSLTEKEALAIECPRIIFFMVGRKRNWPYYLSKGGLNMGDKTDFFEEYKSAKGMNGKSVIDLFNRYRVIDYIDDYYKALHTTGFNEK